MADIIVRQANSTSLTIQSSSNQVIVRQQPNNTVVVQTTGNSYVLPVATNSTLGGIIVGDNLTINANGMLSAQAGGGVSTFNNRTGNVTLLANDVTSLANGVYLADSRVVSVNMSYGTDVFYGLRYSKTPTTPNDYFYAGTTLTASYGVVGVQLPSANLTSTVEFDPDDIFGGIRLRWNNMTVRLAGGGFYSETGTANYAWSSDHFITQGRADSRYATPANLTAYLPTANFTYSNLTGKPNFANVATTGAYADLTGTPNLSLYLTTANAATTYYLQTNPSGYITAACLTYSNITGTPPIATNTTLGMIKVGTTLEIANGVLDVTVLTIDGGSATASGPNIYDGGGA